MYSTTIYFTERRFGGPEEGGWYYDTYEPLDSEELAELKVSTLKTVTQAGGIKVGKLLFQPIVDKLNEGRRPLHSVLSDGVYTILTIEGPPHPMPDRRPTYA